MRMAAIVPTQFQAWSLKIIFLAFTPIFLISASPVVVAIQSMLNARAPDVKLITMEIARCH
jgi:hypothetical protein